LFKWKYFKIAKSKISFENYYYYKIKIPSDYFKINRLERDDVGKKENQKP